MIDVLLITFLISLFYVAIANRIMTYLKAVSYTHLTLPTSDLV